MNENLEEALDLETELMTQQEVRLLMSEISEYLWHISVSKA